MTKIKNTNAYPFDVTISDLDYVIGSDGDNLGKITRNYNIGDLRRYINSGLSPEVGGTLKVSEITYNGVLTSPSEVANALDPNYQVLQYHIVIFSVNGNKYILKEQDITLGLSGTSVTDEDFILIIGFTKLGDGTNVLKGYNTSTGLHEFYSIKKDGNLLNLTESLGNIILSINETELSAFIKENCKTYSVLNAGTGAEIYKDSTVVGDNTQFNFRTVVQEDQGTGESFLRDIQQTTDELKIRVKTLVSDNLTITATDEEVRIETPMTASIPALYVNDLYKPTSQEWLSENSAQNSGIPVVGFQYIGKGTLAQPFTNTYVYTLGAPATPPVITANSAIQNALDGDTVYSYVGSRTRLSPEKVGQTIIVQSNNTNYSFTGNFNYSKLDLQIQGVISTTTTGYLVDLDDPLYFNTSDRVTIFLTENSQLRLNGLGFNNTGTNIATNSATISKIVRLLGEGSIECFENVSPLTRYVINADIYQTGYNNDGLWQFEIGCSINAEFQGLIQTGGIAKVVSFGGKFRTGNTFSNVNTDLKAFYLKGGIISFDNNSSVVFFGNLSTIRTQGFSLIQTGSFIPNLSMSRCSIFGSVEKLFVKETTGSALINVADSGNNLDLFTIEVFDSPNLWGVKFKHNYVASGKIDFTKVDLTQGNVISSINFIGNNVIETLTAHKDREAALLAGRPLYSAYLKTSGVAYPTTTGWVRDIVLPT